MARGYRALGLPGSVDVETVAHEELRWWVVRREIGLAAGTAAGESIARLYAALPSPNVYASLTLHWQFLLCL